MRQLGVGELGMVPVVGARAGVGEQQLGDWIRRYLGRELLSLRAAGQQGETERVFLQL